RRARAAAADPAADPAADGRCRTGSGATTLGTTRGALAAVRSRDATALLPASRAAFARTAAGHRRVDVPGEARWNAAGIARRTGAAAGRHGRSAARSGGAGRAGARVAAWAGF
ncbi:hypothetical protein HGB48_12225, partial [Actinomadura latina]